MAQRLFAICLAALLSGCSLDPSSPVTFRPEARTAAAALNAPPPYAGRSRQRERELQLEMRPIITAAKAQAEAIREQVEEAVGALPVPQRYATREPQLRRFHESLKSTYHDAVRGLFDGALAQLDQLFTDSVKQGELMAQGLAGARSPLDAGASGDPLLDRQLGSFGDTLRMTLNRDRLEAVGFQRAGYRVDKIEVFSSFMSEGADAALGGRLMLFVGGDEQTKLPVCDVVLRVDPGIGPTDRGLFQVVRYRIMAGTTIIEDLGWSLLPSDTGLPPVDVWSDRYLIAPNLAPRVHTDVAAYHQLRSLRVVADVQTAVFDRSRTVLGGVDWRLEFRVSERGELTWQPSAIQPSFNPDCEESRSLVARLAGGRSQS